MRETDDSLGYLLNRQNLFSHYSMRGLLTFLVLATALPMVVLLGYNADLKYEFEIEQSRRLVDSLSEVAVKDAQAFLDSQERVMTILARRATVSTIDPHQCNPSFGDFVELHAYLTNIATLDLDGQLVCTVIPLINRSIRSPSDLPWLKSLVSHNAFSVGQLKKGISSLKWVLILAYPIRNAAGEVTGALTFAVNPAKVNPLAGAVHPQHAVTAIVDSNGTMIARSAEREKWVGSSLRSLELFKQIQAMPKGSAISPGVDGVERLWAFRAIGNTGWTAVSGVPLDNLYVEVHRTLWLNSLVALVILLVSGGLVRLISRRINVPVGALLSAVRSVNVGHFNQQVPVTGPREITDIATGFNAMLERLQVAEQNLSESEAHYRALFDASPDIIRVSCEGHGVTLNQTGMTLFAVNSAAEITNQRMFEIIEPGYREQIRERLRSVIEDKKIVPMIEHGLLLPDGSRIDVEAVSVPVIYRGKPAALCISRDISQRKKADNARRETEARYARVIEGSDVGFWDWDMSGKSFEVSARFESLLGYGPGEWQVTPAQWPEHVHPEDLPAVLVSFDNHVKGVTDKHQVEMRFKTRAGTWKWMMLRGKVAVRDAQGRALIMSGTYADISERKASEAVIWQQANTDVLTGLPNRRMLYDRLDQALKRSKREGARVAVLFIDLDHFKEVNDTLGHGKGDQLLIEAARRISRGMRDSDTVARQGGDEFTVILPELGDTGRVEQVAHSIVTALSERFQLGDDEAFISASIGVTMYPDDALDLEGLLKCADQALYAAKAEGRNRSSYFKPILRQSAHARMRLTNDLRQALAGEQFRVFYQPMVDLSDGSIYKAEALIRWQHPVHGLVSPAEFIPLAESSGLIVEMGNWVFRQAAQQAKQWRAQYRSDFQVSVNKSPVQFLDGGVAQKSWFRYLASLGLPGSSLVIEITEGMLLASRDDVMAQLFDLRAEGMAISLDDFGTGYSSLSYLQKYDIDYVKIDQSFVRHLVPGSKNLALCKAIIVMAHELGMKIVAEGIETAEQLALLTAAGADFGQGYLFARPLPAEEFETMLAASLTLLV